MVPDIDKAQGRFAAGKARIDSNFKTDMYKQCETEGGAFEVAACKVCSSIPVWAWCGREEQMLICQQGVANVYYEAVKAFGKKKAEEFLDRMWGDEEGEQDRRNIEK